MTTDYERAETFIVEYYETFDNISALEKLLKEVRVEQQNEDASATAMKLMKLKLDISAEEHNAIAFACINATGERVMCEESDKCTKYPECGCLYSVHCHDDEPGKGYRICNQCGLLEMLVMKYKPED